MEDQPDKTRGGEVPTSEILSKSWSEVYKENNSEMILDDVPEEWKTVGDIAVEIGMSERAVRTMTKRASELGNIEKKDFRVRHSDSRAARMVTHFKIKNDDSKKESTKEG